MVARPRARVAHGGRSGRQVLVRESWWSCGRRGRGCETDRAPSKTGAGVRVRWWSVGRGASDDGTRRPASLRARARRGPLFSLERTLGSQRPTRPSGSPVLRGHRLHCRFLAGVALRGVWPCRTTRLPAVAVVWPEFGHSPVGLRSSTAARHAAPAAAPLRRSPVREKWVGIAAWDGSLRACRVSCLIGCRRCGDYWAQRPAGVAAVQPAAWRHPAGRRREKIEQGGRRQPARAELLREKLARNGRAGWIGRAVGCCYRCFGQASGGGWLDGRAVVTLGWRCGRRRNERAWPSSASDGRRQATLDLPTSATTLRPLPLRIPSSCPDLANDPVPPSSSSSPAAAARPPRSSSPRTPVSPLSPALALARWPPPSAPPTLPPRSSSSRRPSFTPNSRRSSSTSPTAGASSTSACFARRALGGVPCVFGAAGLTATSSLCLPSSSWAKTFSCQPLTGALSALSGLLA